MTDRRALAGGGTTLIGRLRPASAAVGGGASGADSVGWFVLVTRGAGMAGHFSTAQGEYYLRADSVGYSLVREDSVPLRCGVRDIEKPQRTQRGGSRSRVTGESQALSATEAREDGREIDVLILYTDAALKSVGSVADVESMAYLGAEDMNHALRSSKIDLQVRVVGVEKTDFVETLSYDDETSAKDLDALAFEARGKGARDRRDATRADVVMLFRAQGEMEGIAFLLKSPFDLPYDADRAFGALRIHDVAYKYNFAHEFGHILGSHHNPPRSGFRRYSRGHCFEGSDGVTYGTILSYCGADNRIRHYSNPEVEFMGAPTGRPDLDARGRVDRKSSDEARTFAETKPHLANYRQRQVSP